MSPGFKDFWGSQHENIYGSSHYIRSLDFSLSLQQPKSQHRESGIRYLSGWSGSLHHQYINLFNASSAPDAGNGK
jgi:hypothetical protein